MTVNQVINNGYISSYLAALYNDNRKLFGGALAAPDSDKTILMVTDALNWAYQGGSQTSNSLVGVANYLIWLCGKFGLQAQVITGTGGTVQPVAPINFTPARIDFTVTGSSIIPSGGSSLLLTNFIGYQLDFIRNGIPQSTLNTEPSYFTWNTNTGSFSCSPSLNAGELVSLIPS